MSVAKTQKPNKLKSYFTFSNVSSILGVICLTFSAVLLIQIFGSPVKQEITYQLSKNSSQQQELKPLDPNFTIIIPDLGINSRVIKNISPTNPRLYQAALAKGVAHAEGTSLPGEPGNTFLFAHSSVDLLNASRYNSVFYLIHHLEIGDEIQIWFENKRYVYSISEKLFVGKNETKYLNLDPKTETLTLMTCWPPGTTLKRLIVIAKPLPL